MTSKFVKGLVVSKATYVEGVRPLLLKQFGEKECLPHCAARIDEGSDVLGFDTPQSTDHDWGPRLQLFVPHEKLNTLRPKIDQLLQDELPFEIFGYSTHFGPHDDDGTPCVATNERPVLHRVAITSLETWFSDYLGLSTAILNGDEPVSDRLWLAMPSQRLRTIRSGEVFHCDDERLTRLRDTLSYYPEHIWLFLMSARWTQISQEEAFLGRCGDVGDELGSEIIAARLLRQLMSLCFLIERQYAPYSKWFGTAFSKLKCAAKLVPLMRAVTGAHSWKERQEAMCAVYVEVLCRFNELNVIERVEEKTVQFYNRPYSVIFARNIADALNVRLLADERISSLMRGQLGHEQQHIALGSVDAMTDSTDISESMPVSLAIVSAVYASP